MNEENIMNEGNTTRKERPSLLPQYHDILTVDECAEALQICTKQVRDMIKRNEIPCFRIGTAIRIPKVYLEEYIIRQMENAG